MEDVRAGMLRSISPAQTTNALQILRKPPKSGKSTQHDSPIPYPPELMGEAPLLQPSESIHLTNHPASPPKKSNPSFHLLIPASKSNSLLCKTLLSSFVLGYPSPTLINYGKTFEGDGWDNGTHAGKIRGVYDYLSTSREMHDDDLVLVIDGFDVWFQLPPEIIIRRYHRLLAEADERLRRRYGMVTEEKVASIGSRDRVQKYSQKVIFGADKICWPNPAEDPACAAVPYSTLPTNAYGPETDKDPEAFLNRPRFLNSGNVIGPVAAVQRIYEYAVEKVEKEGLGTLGDQFVFAEIFGEQEYQRETARQASQGAGGRWLEWVSATLGGSGSPLATNQTINNMTVVPGRNYEFGLGLDYGSELFQTMTHSWDDVEFIRYNDSEALEGIKAKHPALNSLPFNLPTDLQRIDDPFWFSSPGNHSNEPKDGILLPFSEKLDVVGDGPSWDEVPLATNLFADSVPVLLHLNGDKSTLDSQWPFTWFHPYARALLRRYVRSPQGPIAAQAAAAGGQSWWDTRGGRGGVWTDRDSWMSWGEVCRKTESDVFGDNKGPWMKEEGSIKTKNSFGAVVIDDEHYEDE